MKQESENSELGSLEADLQNANATIRDLIHALGSSKRTDVTGIPEGALAWATAQASTADSERRFAIVVPDLDAAYRHEANLRFFLKGSEPEVLLFTAADTSPLLDVVPDRRAEMHRMATLTHLAEGRPWRVLIVPASALLRRVPPLAYVGPRGHSLLHGQPVDRDELVRELLELG